MVVSQRYNDRVCIKTITQPEDAAQSENISQRKNWVYATGASITINQRDLAIDELGSVHIYGALQNRSIDQG